jgi:Ner family transcriptional regulator
VSESKNGLFISERLLSNQNEGWHRADILAAVRKRGSSLAEIARAVGLARQTMYWAMSASPRLRANKAIADFLGVSLHELWPQWFDADGKMISTQPLPRPMPKPISRAHSPSMARQRAA